MGTCTDVRNPRDLSEEDRPQVEYGHFLHADCIVLKFKFLDILVCCSLGKEGGRKRRKEGERRLTNFTWGKHFPGTHRSQSEEQSVSDHLENMAPVKEKTRWRKAAQTQDEVSKARVSSHALPGVSHLACY